MSIELNWLGMCRSSIIIISQLDSFIDQLKVTTINKYQAALANLLSSLATLEIESKSTD